MDLTGKIKFIGAVQQVSEKFRKREVVVTDDSSQYPQHILFQLTQDKVVLLDDCKVGDEVKVHFNLRGREWIPDTGDKKGIPQYFNSLEAWRLEKAKWDRAVARSASETPAAEQNNGNPAESFTASTQEDDLPF